MPPAVDLTFAGDVNILKPMKSMTGFGHAETNDQEVSVEVSVRAVNGRHLDLRIHAPRHYLPFESEVKRVDGVVETPPPLATISPGFSLLAYAVMSLEPKWSPSEFSSGLMSICVI